MGLIVLCLGGVVDEGGEEPREALRRRDGLGYEAASLVGAAVHAAAIRPARPRPDVRRAVRRTPCVRATVGARVGLGAILAAGSVVAGRRVVASVRTRSPRRGISRAPVTEVVAEVRAAACGQRARQQSQRNTARPARSACALARKTHPYRVTCSRDRSNLSQVR